MRVSLAALVVVLAGSPAVAQGSVQCQEVAITASGPATILGKGRAMTLAIAAWQREVRAKFGERWMDWGKAGNKQDDCGSAGIGGLGSLQKRCSISAYPCATGGVADAGVPAPQPANDDDDTTTVQRLLVRTGHLLPGDVDGNFGPRTRAAVRRFQAENGLRPTGDVDEATFDRLRMRARG